MTEIIARYAFEVLFTTSTGKRPGFLSKTTLDVPRLLSALEGWKVYSIAYRSYMRFHATITKVRAQEQAPKD